MKLTNALNNCLNYRFYVFLYRKKFIIYDTFTSLISKYFNIDKNHMHYESYCILFEHILYFKCKVKSLFCNVSSKKSQKQCF